MKTLQNIAKSALLILVSHPNIDIDSPACKFLYPAAFLSLTYEALRISDLSRELRVWSHFTLKRVCHSRARVRKARDFARWVISVYVYGRRKLIFRNCFRALFVHAGAFERSHSHNCVF